MRLRETFREAWRNINSRMSQFLSTLFILTCVIATCAGIDGRQVMSIEQKARTYRSSLSNVYVIKAEQQIEPAACQALPQNTGIEAAGGLRKATPIRLTLSKASPLNTYEVSQSFLTVITGGKQSSAMTGGIWLSQALADKFFLHVGSQVDTTAGPMKLAGIYQWPEDGRDTRLGFAALVPVITPSAYDECWASVWPPKSITRTLNQALQYSETSSNAQTEQVNYTMGDKFDPNTEFTSRLTRPLIFAPLLLCFVFGVAVCRRRKLENSGYLHAGEPKSSMVLRLMVEYGLCTLMAVCLTLSISIIVLKIIRVTDISGVLVASLLPTICSTILGMTMGTAVGACSIKEKSLFKHFKDRD